MKFSLPIVFLAIASGVSANAPPAPADEAAPPSVPEAPEAPEAPKPPVAPEAPKPPVAPEAPKPPQGPDAPEAPEDPEKPDAPDAKVSGAPKSGSGCDADFIVTRCLETEQPRATECDPTDYECQCAAYEAIATCYNNCPDDPRASSAQNQVLVFCQQASRSDDISNLESSTGTESATGTLTEFEMFPESTEEVFATSSEEDIVSTTTTATQQNRASNTRTSNSADDEEGAAPNLMRNTGGMLLGVAGVMAIIL